MSLKKIVNYKNWIFEVDDDRTREVYQSLSMGSPEACGCSTCQNFIVNRTGIYPNEFRKLLTDLGVDYQKESEVYHMYRTEKGMHFYGGWFHFKGKIKKGKDSRVVTPHGNQIVDAIALNDNFELGFVKDSSLAFFDPEELDQLIQIEFFAFAKWKLDQALEPE